MFYLKEKLRMRMDRRLSGNTEAQMTSRRVLLLLLTLLFFSFTSSASSQSNSSASVEVDPQDKKGKNNVKDLYNNSRCGGNNGIARRITIAGRRASGGGSGGGRAGSASGSSGSSGSRAGSESGSGSSSPRTPGGAAVIPVYGAAGAANNNKGHHSNLGNRLYGSIGIITPLSATILLSLFTVCLV